MKKLIVEKAKLINNINKINQKAKKNSCRVIAMIKGNGYGLGIVSFARLLCENGISALSVSLFSEAKALREAGINAEIMLLSPLSSVEAVREAAELDIILTASSKETIKVLNKAAQGAKKPVKFQLAIDTGFGRFGFLPSDMQAAAEELFNLENCVLYGCFSHLSDAFGNKEKNSRAQFDKFNAAISDLRARGIDTGVCHIANSSAFMRFEYMCMDAVRIGSAFLGRLIVKDDLGLEKIAFLESEVIDIKALPVGHNIGYANTYTLKKNAEIAVVPVGYMDGFGVCKENDTFRFMDCIRYAVHNVLSAFRDMRRFVVINGKKCPILGRISMFNIVCDVTGAEVKLGDKVVLSCNPILIDSSIEREYR